MARSLPTGTVTFLFTDIEGSTRLAAMLGDEYAALLEQHRVLLREAISAHHGHEVGTEGDALFVAFERVTDALAAAVDGQLNLQRHAWPPSGAVRVRMGLHTGEAQVVADDYVGVAVHEAQRISSAGHGGQILLSKLSRDLAGGALPPDTSVRSLGLFRLKDITGLTEIFQIDHPELVRDFPPLRTRASVPSNLPAQLTSFVGRQRERSEVVAAFTTARLLTLTGPGGVGKTRLAVETATAVRDRYDDGVWLVDLAPLSEAALVPSLVGRAVGVRESAEGTDIERLVSHLEDRAVLVLLDNCEHLVGAVADVAGRVVASCRDVGVLATSREPLGVPGEVVYPVPPMTVAEDGDLPDAVRLFVDRVRLHDPMYAPSDDDIAPITEICKRLDGLPLAIELAAAHMRMLGPREIAERLTDRFAFLGRGPRSAGERQQTLRSTLDWGYDLLSEAERVLLSRLAIFSGGFSLDAVEGICSGGDIEADRVYELMTALVDKSLVMRSIRGGRTRYWLLETIREYGLAKIAELASAAPVAAQPISASVLFTREGEVWSIGPEASPIRLRDSKGLRYLAVLLAQPGTDVGVLDLVEAVSGSSEDSRQQRAAIGDAGEALDVEAVRAYRRRLEEISEELDEARTFGNTDRAAALEDEAARLSRELAGGLGLGGRHRKPGSTVERARLSVTKAIRSAISKIAASAPDLGKHLDASVRTGTRCGYFPEAPSPVWDLRPQDGA